jgi:hypothetical protein
MLQGRNIVDKKPLGKIRLITDHISPNGQRYKKDQVFEYYAVYVKSECGSCGKQGYNKTYKVKGGNIPFEKAIII